MKDRLTRPPVQRFRVKASSATPVRTGNSVYPGPYSVDAQRPSPAPHYGYQPSIPTSLPPSTAPFRPALPQGVITEDIVASLERYPVYEQQAWASTLPPSAMQVYRSILAKRGQPPTRSQYDSSRPAIECAAERSSELSRSTCHLLCLR